MLIRWINNILMLHCFSDYIVVGSDSGRIVILEYVLAKNAFEKVIEVEIIWNSVLHYLLW